MTSNIMLILCAAKAALANLNSKKTFFFFSFLLIVSAAFGQPSISSFAPTSGPVGTSVTISGSGFSSTPSGNIVFFGAVKATVSSASASSLTVQVPAGATYQPITVTANGLTAYSAKPFVVTFSGGNDFVAANLAFDPPIDSTTDLHPNDVALADFDGDGKVDLATANNYSISGQPASVSILRNTGSPRNISFAPRLDIATGIFTYGIAAADLNGDGKPDLISSSIADQKISIYKNTSTTGNISFASKIDYPSQESPYRIAVNDIDGDGKPDIVVANNIFSNTVSVFKNTSTNGNISFAPKIDLASNISPYSVTINDFDGDSKPDIAVCNEFSNTISVFRNTSTVGSISFAQAKDFTTGTTPKGITSGDIDGDGKTDIATANYGANSFSALRNISTIGNIVFEAKKDFSVGANPLSLSMGDLNGDGKPEVVVPSFNLAASQNTSTVGNINFGNRMYFFPGINPNLVGIGDLDGDGMNDLAGSLFTSEKIKIYRNRNNEPTITSFNPTSTTAGTNVTINGIGFTSTTAVSFGGVVASSFTIVSPTSIIANVPNTISGDIRVTTSYGTATKSGFIFAAPPTISSFTPTSGGQQTTITITGTNFTGATAVKFGGIAAASFTVVSPTTITATAGNGNSGDISVTNPYGTASISGFIYIPPPGITSFSPVAASTGGTITITGTNFNNVTNVSFGGTSAASFNVVSTTEIKAVVGAGASGNVSVTTSGGTTSKTGFTILPSISSFSPTSAGYGTTVTITGNNFSQVTMVKFGGSNASSFTINSSTSISAVVGGGFSGDVSLVTAAGTVSMPGFTFIFAPSISSFAPLRGGPGTVITITGTNFTNASAVSIGGVPASSFTVISPTTITAVVANTVSGNVDITTPGGKASIRGFIFTGVPVINSFTPLSAAPGAVVTITGANFNNNPSDNIVYFGGVKASVQSASSNSLMVTVPAGATHGFISVSTGYLTGFSLQAFIPSFSATVPFSSTSYSGKIDFSAGTNPYVIKAGDLDGDSKPDLVVINRGSNTVSIYKNTSTLGILAFANKIDLPTVNKPNYVELADINSDGQLEILYTTTNISGSTGANDNAIFILENESTSSKISFKAAKLFATLFNPTHIATGDLNGDGRTDIAITNHGQVSISVFSNTSVNGVISFSQRQDFPPTGDFKGIPYPTDISIVDLNGDEKPDIAVGNDGAIYYSVFENESSSSMAPHFLNTRRDFDFAFGGSSSGLTIADFNLDKRTDMIIRDGILTNAGHTEYYFLGFTHQVKVYLGGIVSIGDINGDGKPDVVRANSSLNTITALVNTTTSNNISFAPTADFNTGNYPSSVWIGDLDGDGKPEIATANYNDNNISILRNQNGGASVAACEGVIKTLATQSIGTTYQWQQDNGSGFVDISNSTLFQGVTTNTLTLNNVSASLNGYKYRCIVNGNPDIPFILIVNANTSPTVSISTANSTICAGANTSFIATPTNGGTSPSYQWKVNGANVGTNSNTFTSSTLNNNDQVSVVLTSNASCVATPTANSNIITLTVSPSVTPTVSTSVSANNICAGTSVTFTATPTNGGTTPSYQWQVNNVNVGANSNTFTSTALNNNDQVKVIMTSNASCATTPTATSTPITMIVNASTKVSGKASSPAQVCVGTSYNVSFSSTNAPNGSSVQLWENINNGTFTSGSTQTYSGSPLSFSIINNSVGIKKYFFKMTLPAGNACAIANNSDTSTTVVDQLAKPIIAATNNTITITNGDAGANYKWQIQNAGNWNDITPLASGLSYTATVSGMYRVQANKGTCIDYSDAQSITITDPNTNSGQTVLLYPNPTQGMLTLDSLKLTDNWEVLDIISLQSGQKVASFNIINQTKVTVNLTTISNGVYAAVLRRRDGSSISIEFVKM